MRQSTYLPCCTLKGAPRNFLTISPYCVSTPIMQLIVSFIRPSFSAKFTSFHFPEPQKTLYNTFHWLSSACDWWTWNHITWFCAAFELKLLELPYRSKMDHISHATFSAIHRLCLDLKQVNLISIHDTFSFWLLSVRPQADNLNQAATIKRSARSEAAAPSKPPSVCQCMWVMLVFCLVFCVWVCTWVYVCYVWVSCKGDTSSSSAVISP